MFLKLHVISSCIAFLCYTLHMAESSDDFRERYTSKHYKQAYEEEFATAKNVTARTIFKKSEEDIANELVRLALHADSDRNRLSACTTIVEHLIGKPKPGDSDGDALSDALEKIKSMPLTPNDEAPVFKPKPSKFRSIDDTD